MTDGYTVTPDVSGSKEFPPTLAGLTGAISRAMFMSFGAVQVVTIVRDGTSRAFKSFQYGREIPSC
jgi:hypothetical protein